MVKEINPIEPTQKQLDAIKKIDALAAKAKREVALCGREEDVEITGGINLFFKSNGTTFKRFFSL